MANANIPESCLDDKPEIPPPRVEDKFERWHETYSVNRLEELTISDIEAAELEFRNEVEKLRTEYRPGSSITPAMAQLAGKEPFTQAEFREVRRCITDEAEQIRMNFRQARGRRREEREQQRTNRLTKITGRIADSLTNIRISFELPKFK